MASNKVRQFMQQYHKAEDILTFSQSTATVQQAAEALGVEEARIAKRLSFYGEEQQAFVVVCAGDAKIDNAAFKEVFGLKAKMLQAQDVELLTGHPIGGVCPFALQEGVVVYLDRSLQRFQTVYPACGTPNSAIELTCEELE